MYKNVARSKIQIMTKEKFLELLKNEVSSYKTFLETADNQWIVKGFVDVDKNVYTISNDTKSGIKDY